MSDKFFIRYANKLFKDDPKNLKLVIQDFIEQHRIMREAGRSESESYPEWCLGFMADTIGIFSDCKDFDSALKITPKIKSQAKLEIKSKDLRPYYNVDVHIDMALEAVFYQRDGFCDNTWEEWVEDESCPGYQGRSKKFKSNDQHDFGLGENYRIKCHECCQLFFRSMLLNFVKNKGFHKRIIKKGEKYSYVKNVASGEIKSLAHSLLDEKFFDENLPGKNELVIMDYNNRHSFDYYIARAYDCVESSAYVPIHSQDIVKYEHFAMTNLFDDQRSIYPLDKRFNDYLISVVSYSLVEFLRKNNFKKLKVCPFCNNFFTAGDIRRTRCYEKECERAYQRDKKRKQRENDPVKYV